MFEPRFTGSSLLTRRLKLCSEDSPTCRNQGAGLCPFFCIVWVTFKRGDRYSSLGEWRAQHLPLQVKWWGKLYLYWKLTFRAIIVFR